MAQARLIVRGQREEERAFRPQFHINPRHLKQLGGESGPACLAFATERDEGLFAGLRLRARRQHAGGGVACAGAGRAPVEDLDRHAPRRQPPTNGQPDDPGTDDGDIGPAEIGCWAVRQAAAPFAGMTQTKYTTQVSTDTYAVKPP